MSKLVGPQTRPANQVRILPRQLAGVPPTGEPHLPGAEARCGNYRYKRLPPPTRTKHDRD